MKTALFWTETDSARIRCELCPHACLLGRGQTGRCRVRTNVDGELKAVGYGVMSGVHLDPIEKKPLYHFYPGSAVFSIGGWGCNLSCSFCQNWTISQCVDPTAEFHSVEEVVRTASSLAQKSSEPRPVIGIAYTYNEPLVGYEFVAECARASRTAGLRNVLVTNGYVNRAPAAELLPWIDGINLDIKSMEESFYSRHCGGELKPVLQFARQSVDAGCHLEITNLVIPGLNDTDALFRQLADWIADNLGPRTPLHLSGYHPMYKMDRPATGLDLLQRAFDICVQRLSYVYMGNVASEARQNTYCPGCRTLLIERRGYSVKVKGVVDGRCGKCGRRMDLRPG